MVSTPNRQTRELIDVCHSFGMHLFSQWLLKTHVFPVILNLHVCSKDRERHSHTINITGLVSQFIQHIVVFWSQCSPTYIDRFYAIQMLICPLTKLQNVCVNYHAVKLVCTTFGLWITDLFAAMTPIQCSNIICHNVYSHLTAFLNRHVVNIVKYILNTLFPPLQHRTNSSMQNRFSECMRHPVLVKFW